MSEKLYSRCHLVGQGQDLLVDFLLSLKGDLLHRIADRGLLVRRRGQVEHRLHEIAHRNRVACRCDLLLRRLEEGVVLEEVADPVVVPNL